MLLESSCPGHCVFTYSVQCCDAGTIHCIVSWIDKALNFTRRRFKGFTPQELTEGLNKLAVNDSNKMKVRVDNTNNTNNDTTDNDNNDNDGK